MLVLKEATREKVKENLVPHQV